ncbi:MAG TPA: tetratricopeptide repeat protein [Polyangiaceae bacterium LLY-WYZ-15_(1-7)]|nr:hypothetical protein [Myxococcales bacterium]MAT27052.1 hypothetical protein [Sandaracinus sp.]HJL01976.1 tetratricopeptide repeat protein [Polyangiaceae bacterium LLY-WYZ-15_(1-7)]HJL07976.1 tetratricopeptide repeat protein [Polyangiaceae bacterium LLY-WYZ-15_(1-7)]HJL26557.1 tetratricopeptide repeat protein [Polyangiaceae bacterium LLY-WYZ-15_(1-7)]
MSARLGMLAFALAALSFPGGLAQAQSLEAIFEEANGAYLEERWDEAVAGYERLVELGVADADVEYDLATAHAKAGRYGAAVRHYERALRLRPGDDGAEDALEAARALLAERRAAEEGVGEIETARGFGDALVRPFSEAGLAWTVLGAEALLFLTIALLFRARRRLGVVLVLIVATLVFLASGFGLLAKRRAFAEGEPAVVLEDRAVLREGPDERHPARGEAREGDWATILERDDAGFVLVEVGSRRGWVHEDAVGAI